MNRNLRNKKNNLTNADRSCNTHHHSSDCKPSFRLLPLWELHCCSQTVNFESEIESGFSATFSCLLLGTPAKILGDFVSFFELPIKALFRHPRFPCSLKTESSLNYFGKVPQMFCKNLSYICMLPLIFCNPPMGFSKIPSYFCEILRYFCELWQKDYKIFVRSKLIFASLLNRYLSKILSEF